MVLVVKNPPVNAGDVRGVCLIAGLGRSPGGGNGNPLQCSCLENPMDRGAWWAIVHRVAKSQTQLKQLSTHTQAWASQVALVVQSPPANARDVRNTGLTPGWGRSPGGVHGNPLQFSCLENPKDRGTWWATVHGVARSWTRLKRLSTHAGMRRPWDSQTGRIRVGASES